MKERFLKFGEKSNKMGTIRIFESNNKGTHELVSLSESVEKSLQKLIEANLEKFLNIRFLSSEHSTGKTYGGRIDTLGIDENKSPVIIEYKRSISESVINQGLFYLTWLLDHKAEFELLVLKKFGKEESMNIEWQNARLLCIASDFTKYDQAAIEQIDRNIELIRYRRFENDLILFEQVNATTAQETPKMKGHYATVMELFDKMGQKEKERYDELKTLILTLGDDIVENETKYYIAFKRLSNFACVEFHPNTGDILVFVKLDLKTTSFEKGFARNVTDIGHYGTGNVEIRVNDDEDVQKAFPLIRESYEMS